MFSKISPAFQGAKTILVNGRDNEEIFKQTKIVAKKILENKLEIAINENENNKASCEGVITSTRDQFQYIGVLL